MTAREPPPVVPRILVGCGPALVVVGTGAATYSVVRYDLRIVATYTVLVVLLAVALAAAGRRRGGTRRSLHAQGCAAGLGLAAVVTWRVPGFTYLHDADATRVRGVLAIAALLAGLALLLPWRRAGDAALAVAAAGYLTAAVLLMRLDPAPGIDVWYTLQGAADGLASGQDMYRQVWVGPPGVMAAFTYLPWTAVLLAPGRWLFGDVRIALAALTVATALAVRLGSSRPAGGQEPEHQEESPRDGARVAAGLAALLLLVPGTSTQVEQGWTEPLLLACLAGAALALCRRGWATAAVFLALGLASKQHLALLLPLLAAWPRFGLRRTLWTAIGAGLLMLPWLLADPRAMLDDTVSLLVRFPPLRFADSLYIAAVNDLGWTPPLWATGAVVVGTLCVAAALVHRRDPSVGEFLRWCALVLFVANLVNKQAFYNQYWLVAAIMLVSWTPSLAERSASEPRTAPATPPAPA